MMNLMKKLLNYFRPKNTYIHRVEIHIDSGDPAKVADLRKKL